MIPKNKKIIINGKENGKRIESRVLEEKIQKAVKDGYRNIEVNAFGQHGIGGRLWSAGSEKVKVSILNQSGQRTGSFGFANTEIKVFGPASDDVGWLNAGAKIIVDGHCSNGVANAMAQGKIYVNGNIGSRGMTMTKSNPRFEPPELWVLGSVGDYFGEFMAGGIAVVCGIESQTPNNILGYRPLVGMVGGKVFFRGKHKGFSENDTKIETINDKEWKVFIVKLKTYLKNIKRNDLLKKLLKRKSWKLLVAKTPQEKNNSTRRSLSDFKSNVWNKELGKGGLIGDINTSESGVIPIIAEDNLRRYIPVWENEKYKSPCQNSCPTDIPIQKRWSLIREGRFKDAVDLAFIHTPFPVSICGYLCPNICMQGCTKNISHFSHSMKPIDIAMLGKASTDATVPKFLSKRKETIAIIGGGVAGISAAWQLIQKGFAVKIFDREKKLGGKVLSHIPNSRIPKNIINKELDRVSKIIPYERIDYKLKEKHIKDFKKKYDYLIIAIGTYKPRRLNIKGINKAITALEFLKKAKKNNITTKNDIVIIGAGNVGCDVATEAHRFGFKNITLIDMQKPASFGKERQEAEEIGAKFKWPCITNEITSKGIKLSNGEFLPADTVVISIGDIADLDFLPKQIKTNNGLILTDKDFRTSDRKIFAIGDVAKLGLLTDAVGAGKKSANAIIKEFTTKNISDKRDIIDTHKISLEYFNPKPKEIETIDQCSIECASCGLCRDCGICIEVCPNGAIFRKDLGNKKFEYIADNTRCIGCGFCQGACPCGIWQIISNPVEPD